MADNTRPSAPTPEALPPRFQAKIVVNHAGCWEWQGSLTDGYGRARMGRGRRPLAHRIIWELLVGKVPAGLHLDHLCRVRHCVNPAHLEPVTHRENVRRGNGACGVHARATHCPQGHAYEGDNLVLRRNGARTCRACKNIQNQAYKRRKRERRG